MEKKMRYYKECGAVLSRLESLNDVAVQALKLALDTRVADYHSAFQVERFVVSAAKSPEERWKDCIREIRGKLASLAGLAVKIERETARRNEKDLPELDAMELDMCVAKLLDQREALESELSTLVGLAAQLECAIPETQDELERRAWLEKLRREVVTRINLRLPITPDLAELAISLPESVEKQKLLGWMSRPLPIDRKEEDEPETHLLQG
jgi:hypothetical protein